MPTTAAMVGLEKAAKASVRSLRKLRRWAAAVEIWTSSLMSMPAVVGRRPLGQMGVPLARSAGKGEGLAALTTEGALRAAGNDQGAHVVVRVQRAKGLHDGADHGLAEGVALGGPVQL